MFLEQLRSGEARGGKRAKPPGARRILYLSQWFLPENSSRGLRIAQALIARGHDVEVLTGFPNYPTGKIQSGYRLRPYMRERMEGVTVHRVFLYPSHDSSSVGRALNYLSFFVSALIFCLLRGRRYDAIYVYHPPITVGLAAALSALFTRRSYVLEVQDLWPDSVATSGMKGTTRLADLLGPVCRFVYRRATVVLAQSREMARCLIERGVPANRVSTIYNWADETTARASGSGPAPLGDPTDFTFVFGGNIGKAQGLDTLVHAARVAALSEPSIRLVLIGDGVERDRITALAETHGQGITRLLPAVPQERIGDIFAAADVLVLHLIDHPLFTMTIPSKLQFYMAMGRPILAGLRGEAADIVRETKAGRVVPPDDVDAMAAAMVEMARLSPRQLTAMGGRARNAYWSTYSFTAAMKVIEAALGKALGRGVLVS